MGNVIFGGPMMGVSGIQECDTCKWADIYDGPRTIRKGNVTFVQNGKHNIDCIHTGDKTIDFTGDDMKCSGWEPRE